MYFLILMLWLCFFFFRKEGGTEQGPFVSFLLSLSPHVLCESTPNSVKCLYVRSLMYGTSLGQGTSLGPWYHFRTMLLRRRDVRSLRAFFPGFGGAATTRAPRSCQCLLLVCVLPLNRPLLYFNACVTKKKRNQKAATNISYCRTAITRVD